MTYVLALSFTAATIAATSHPQREPEASPHVRTVYVSATDKNGTPVADLTAADFVVKEGGKARTVVAAQPATMPMRIALIIDDNGTGIFRYAVGRFIERLQGKAEFALSTVAGQHLKIVDYTADVTALSDAIARLTARPGTADGGQLLEGIFEVAKDLERRKAPRSIIVALTVGGEEHSTLPGHHVLDQLRKSGAALHVVSVTGSVLRSMATVQKPAALLGENLNLNEVLGDGPKQSGGRRDEIVASAGLVVGLQQLAQTLNHQYAIQYARPERSSGKLNVSVNRAGVTVRAPERVPDR